MLRKYYNIDNLSIIKDLRQQNKKPMNNSQQSKGKMLISLLGKVSKHQKCNPQTISSEHYTQQMHIQQDKLTALYKRQQHNGNQQHSNRQDDLVDNQSLIKIYCQLFGNKQYESFMVDLSREKLSRRSLQIKKQQFLLQSIMHQISYLQQINEDYTKFHKLLQKSAKAGTNQEKWKIIVLTYRQKIQKYEYQLEQQKRLKGLIQKELDARILQIQRLSNMNNLKFQKINEVIEELDLKAEQIEQRNNTINQIQMDLSSANLQKQQMKSQLAAAETQKQKLKQQLMQATHSLNQLTQSLLAERQKSYIEHQKYESKLPQGSVVLEGEDGEVNRQIKDLKLKYELEIQQLEEKLIQYQQEIQQLNSKQESMRESYQDCCTQTEQNVVKASYYNSLQADLQEQQYPKQAGTFNQQDDYLDELQLSINPHSSHNHIIYTPRQVDAYSDKDEQNYMEDTSFELENRSHKDGHSRDMEKVEELTMELEEAYQKIDEFANKIEILERQNNRLKMKSNLEKERIQGKAQHNRSIGGYFTSFFKK